MPNDSASGIAARISPGLPIFRFPKLIPQVRRIAAGAQGAIVASADVLALACAALAGSFIHGAIAGPWTLAPPNSAHDILAVADPGRQGYGFAAVLVVLLVQLAKSGHYSNRGLAWNRAPDVVSAVAVAALCDLFLTLEAGFAGRGTEWITMWASLVPLILMYRGGARVAMAQIGLWDVRIVLFGSPEHTTRATEAMQSDSGAGLKVVGAFERNEVGDAGEAANWRSLMARSGGNYIALVGLPNDWSQEARAVVALQRSGIPFALIHPTGGLPVARWRARYFFSHDVLMLVNAAGRPGVFSRVAKRAMDVCVAGFLLIGLSPLLIAIAVLVRQDGGRALFYHQRVGACGRYFYCVKFRSMRVDAAEVLDDLLAKDPVAAAEWTATQKLRDDPRITSMGRFLRQTSLDELPQLFNILRGQMSLVGPRPIVAAEARFYGELIGDYCAARPGVTGLWQVSGRSNTSYQRRVELDTWYARNPSLWHDLGILAKTVPAVLFRRGAV